MKIDFNDKLKDIKENLSDRERAARKKWKNFSNEMQDAYSHLKKAFAV